LNLCQEEIIMELKAIIAIGLVLFIIGGLIFLKNQKRKKIAKATGAAIRGRPSYIPKKELERSLMADERTI